MPRYRGDYTACQALPRQDLQHLRFREKGIVEHGRQDLWMPFGQQCSRDACRPATRQHDLLSQSDLREAAGKQLFRLTPEFGVSRRLQANLHQIEQVEVAQKAHAYQARRMRMRYERSLHAIALQERLAPRNLFQNSLGEFFALQEQTEVRLIESGMIEKREQYIFSRVVQEYGDLLGGCRLHMIGLKWTALWFFRHIGTSVSHAGKAFIANGALRCQDPDWSPYA
jgi:hypothetical protein